MVEAVKADDAAQSEGSAMPQPLPLEVPMATMSG
jgi:hypothetical protein